MMTAFWCLQVNGGHSPGGLPRGGVFGVWAKDFGHAFHAVAVGFRMDEAGVAAKPGLRSASVFWLDRH